MTTSRNGRRRLLALGVVAAGLGLGTLSQASAGTRSPSDPSGGSTGAVEAPVHGAHPSVSDDGRQIVFEGLPTDGSDRQRTIWWRDASTPDLADVELTVPFDGVRLGESVRPSISGDGCVVAFVTEMALDLFRDDDSGARWDVYRLVLPHCGGDLDDWELVSTQSSSDGDTSALDRVAADEAPALSQTGSVIAFTHQARAGKDLMTAVSVVDLTVPLGVPGRISVVAGTPLLAPNTTFLYRGQRQPDVSDDGRFVAYTSDATSDAAVPEWGSGPVGGQYATSQVYLWDRDLVDGAVTLVSALDGVAASGGAGSPVISGNGQYVAFESASADLAGGAVLPECGAVCAPQVYRFDQVDQAVVLVSREQTPDGERFVAADAGAGQATISDDGTQVGFVTRSRNLFATQSSAVAALTDGDIVVAEVDRGIVRRASVLPDGVTPGPAAHAHPALSGSGHVIVFDTLAAAPLTGVERSGRQVVSIGRPAQLSAPSLDVGTVGVGFPGNEWYVAIRNEGPSTFQPATVTSSRPDFAITGGTCALGLPVPPGQSCTVYVVLTPSRDGLIEAELTVTESVFGGTSITSELLGAGGDPTLTATFTGLDFEPTQVGRQGAAMSSDIGNIGFAPATIAGIAITGANPDDFVIENDSCIGYSINPGATCSIEVSFVPTEAGHRTATVLVSTTLGQYTTVLVNGDGTRTARLTVQDAKVRAGDPVGVGGSGFRPNSEVTLSWADGRGSSTTVVANETGDFLALLPTRHNEPAGDRVVVAQSGDVVAKADVQVVRRPTQTAPGSPVFGG